MMTKQQRSVLDEAIRVAARTSDRQRLVQVFEVCMGAIHGIGVCARAADHPGFCGAVADRCFNRLVMILEIYK